MNKRMNKTKNLKSQLCIAQYATCMLECEIYIYIYIYIYLKYEDLLMISLLKPIKCLECKIFSYDTKHFLQKVRL